MPSIGCHFAQQKIKKLQTLQNEFLRIVLKKPGYVRNKQLHNDKRLLTLPTKTDDKPIHFNLYITERALHYEKTFKPRLKPSRIPQEMWYTSRQVPLFAECSVLLLKRTNFRQAIECSLAVQSKVIIKYALSKMAKK